LVAWGTAVLCPYNGQSECCTGVTWLPRELLYPWQG
jgi:hypothetical protein